jgi:hypothetical protein
VITQGVARDASMTAHKSALFQNTEDVLANTVCRETHRFDILLRTLTHTADGLQFIIDKICINLIRIYEIPTHRIIG